MFPWWYFTLVLALAFFVFVIVRNSRRFRRELGAKPTVEEVRQKYPNAWVFLLRKRKDG